MFQRSELMAGLEAWRKNCTHSAANWIEYDRFEFGRAKKIGTPKFDKVEVKLEKRDNATVLLNTLIHHFKREKVDNALWVLLSTTQFLSSGGTSLTLFLHSQVPWEVLKYGEELVNVQKLARPKLEKP